MARGVTLMAMWGLVLLALVAGCVSSGGFMPEDMAIPPDIASEPPDFNNPNCEWIGGVCYARRPDLTPAPDLAWTDLAGGVDIAEPPPDLVQVADLRSVDLASSSPPDMAQLCSSAVPACSAQPLPNGTYCCNAAQCINGNCWNPPGGYCCIDNSCNPVVVCWQSPGVATGVCLPGNKCQ